MSDGEPAVARPVLRIQKLKGAHVGIPLEKDEVTIGKNDPVAGIRNDIVFKSGEVTSLEPSSVAVEAALAMRDRHLEFQKGLPEHRRFAMRLGVNAGEVVAGYMGSLRRMEYMVLGKPVVVAKRLESLADPDCVFAGRETWSRCRESFSFERVGDLRTPKGDERLEVFRVTGSRP